MIAIDEQELTPQQSEAVRRLLAEARHDEPMPPEVVARLDGVLAELREGPGVATRESGSAPRAAWAADQEPSPDDTAGSVRPLRRRSKLPQMMLAAAAVVAIGFGVTQILPTGDDDGAGSGDTTFSSDEAPEGDSADEAPSMGAQPPTDAEKDQEHTAAARAKRLIDRVPLTGLAPLDTGQLEARRATQATCGPKSLGDGERRVPASYEGDPAVVVFRTGEDGARQADVYVCNAADPRQRITSVPLTER